MQEAANDIPQMQIGPVTVYFGEKNGKYPDGNLVVITGSDTKMVCDTPKSVNRFPEVVRDADLVVQGHVHEDHVCGLHLLPETPVFAHEEDVRALRSVEGLRAHYGYPEDVFIRMLDKLDEEFQYTPRPDAQAYEDDAVWELGGCRVRAVHMPGHTRGHSVLLVEPHGVAFIGDIDLAGFGPYYGDATSNLLQFQRSLERVERLPAKAWITSHHKGVITDRKQFVELLHAFGDKIKQRSDRIVEALREAGEAGMSLDELVQHRFLYPQGFEDLFVDAAERKTITEHLAMLVPEGRVREDADGRLYAMAA